MEESPVSTMGLVKQRSRWLYGHLRDLYYSKEPVSLITISFLCVWSLVPFTLGTLLIGFFICPLDNFYPIFDDFIVLMMASEAFQHFYGAQLNFRLPTAQRLALTFCYITHIPLVVAMVVESCAVFHAIFTLISPTKSPIFSHTQKAVVRRTLSNKLR